MRDKDTGRWSAAHTPDGVNLLIHPKKYLRFDSFRKTNSYFGGNHEENTFFLSCICLL
jgi:hypothetical protein